MSEYTNFDVDFIERTLWILERYCDEFEVTILINCAVGLIILPKERHFENLRTISIDNDLHFGITRSNIKFIEDERPSLQFNAYDKYNLRNVITHMRNAIAHGRIQQESVINGRIASLKFEDKHHGKKTFEAIFSIDEFRQFSIAVAKEILSNKKPVG